MKLARLLGITMELLTKRRVTATDLAARFEVSIRTIYRDIELINQAGVPVASFSGADGGFELMNGFFLTKQTFSLDDLLLIYSLLKGVDTAFGSGLANKLSALQPALQSEELQKKVVMELGGCDEERSVIRNVLQAVQQKKRVGFSYTDALNHESHRKAEPFHLLWEKGVWYVECYCLKRSSVRIFRVSRMRNLQVLEETSVSSEVTPKSASEVNEEIHTLLRFDASMKQRISEQFQEAWFQTGENISVNMVFYTWSYAISVVLSYGAMVEVVYPKELREKVMQEVVAVQQIYI